MKIILIFVSLFFSITTLALVNMEFRDYSQEWSDLKDFPKTRKYQVKSNGVFGPNWCSILDLTGQCSFKNIKNLNLKFIVKNKKVIKVHNGSNIYSIKYNQGLVSQILLKNKIISSFSYKNGQLVSVINEWLNIYNYEYSSSQNLTKVLFSDKSHITILYNDQSEVSMFIDREGCTESYTYEKNYEHITSYAIKKCQGKTVANNKYEIWKKNKTTSRVKTTKNGNVEDIIYDKNLNPLKVTQDNYVLIFEYYKNGSIKSKANNYYKVNYIYKNKRIGLVKETNLKTNEINTIQYSYKGNNVTSAKDSYGLSVYVSHYQDGKIKTIIDNTGKNVNIEYSQKLQKPSKITVDNVGSLNINYDQHGSILNIESSQSSEAKLRISKNLNELLDLLQYADKQ